ncbi:hypothetical protein Droror1_Dr00017210 [Drosera rotundifolia]
MSSVGRRLGYTWDYCGGQHTQVKNLVVLAYVECWLGLKESGDKAAAAAEAKPKRRRRKRWRKRKEKKKRGRREEFGCADGSSPLVTWHNLCPPLWFDRTVGVGRHKGRYLPASLIPSPILSESLSSAVALSDSLSASLSSIPSPHSLTRGVFLMVLLGNSVFVVKGDLLS